ncbi:ankyrin repeat-containing domain protein, partial [Podospora australis]
MLRQVSSRNFLGHPNASTLINLRENDGSTALHYVVREGNLDATRLLLCYGADPNAEDHKQLTPLHRSVIVHFGWPSDMSAKIARLFLIYEADVDAKDGEGKTPLYWAIDTDCVDMAKSLLAWGANDSIIEGFVNHTVEVRQFMRSFACKDIKSQRQFPASPPQCSAKAKPLCEVARIAVTLSWSPEPSVTVAPSDFSHCISTSYWTVHELLYKASKKKKFFKGGAKLLCQIRVFVQNLQEREYEVSEDDILTWVHIPGNN